MSKFKTFGAFVKTAKLRIAKTSKDAYAAGKQAYQDTKEGYNSIEKLEEKVSDKK